MANNYIDKFKKNNVEYDIHAQVAVSAETAQNSVNAENVDKIGNVRKYSGNYDGKQREGLQFINTAENGSESLIELNSKGNFAVESLTKHLNLESAKGIQMKPTTNIILDSTRRLIAGKGNEIQVEAKFDDFGDVTGYDGDDEEWAELKINSRNLDLRCHEHGGIALQIAGKDKQGYENKIKFESDRTNPITEQGTYNGEGGKGLEFGTFNNEHSSLFTKDYRFNKNGDVYAVDRDTPVYDSGKTDYPTQSDDFKDIINEMTPVTKWNDIVKVSAKYRLLKDYTTENEVQALITQRAAELATSGSVTLDGYATEAYVDNAIEHIETGSYEAGNGISIIDKAISVNNYNQIVPLTALTDSTTALGCVKIGKSKGNLQLDVKGKYTYEAKVDAVDEYGNAVEAGGRVVNYQDESFYEDPRKYYYKANSATTYADGEYAPKGARAYTTAVISGMTERTYFYKAKNNASYYDETPAAEGDIILKASITGETEIAYYDNPDNRWVKNYILPTGDDESHYTGAWEKVNLWVHNEININLESDSKIKFDGKKIETTWSYPEVEGGDDVDHRMEEISLAAESLAINSTVVNTEKKVTKNGDFTEEPMLSYTFENKLLDENGSVVVTESQFVTNYKKKHVGTTLTDEEIKALYSEYIAMGVSETITVRVSDLLRLVGKVAELETRIAALENQE